MIARCCRPPSAAGFVSGVAIGETSSRPSVKTVADVHRVVTSRMQRMLSLRRSSICIDSIGTIRVPFFGEIVLMSKPHVRVIVDAAAQKNVVAPTAFDNECRGAGNLGRSRREPERRTFLPGSAGRLK